MKNISALVSPLDFEINKIDFSEILPLLGNPVETDPADKCPIWFL
ncbi:MULTISPECIES: hypothetical protein [Sphingobacterium]|jgi:hypothetical protein|nr:MULTISPECIES: hypothetical protein [Sphingobacterium]